MTRKLKVTTIGTSVGVILPKDLLAHLRVGKGDTLFAMETTNGIEITSYDEEFAEDMAAAEKIMNDNRDLLRLLAK